MEAPQFRAPRPSIRSERRASRPAVYLNRSLNPVMSASSTSPGRPVPSLRRNQNSCRQGKRHFMKFLPTRMTGNGIIRFQPPPATSDWLHFLGARCNAPVIFFSDLIAVSYRAPACRSPSCYGYPAYSRARLKPLAALRRCKYSKAHTGRRSTPICGLRSARQENGSLNRRKKRGACAPLSLLKLAVWRITCRSDQLERLAVGTDHRWPEHDQQCLRSQHLECWKLR